PCVIDAQRCLSDITRVLTTNHHAVSSFASQRALKPAYRLSPDAPCLSSSGSAGTLPPPPVDICEQRCVADDPRRAHLGVLRLQFTQHRIAAEAVSDQADGSSATEGIENDVTRARAGEHRRLDELRWEGGEMGA